MKGGSGSQFPLHGSGRLDAIAHLGFLRRPNRYLLP